MEQMNAAGLDTIDVNFEDPALTETVRKLRPLVWHDETSICVLLGPDPQAGVFGCGPTIKAALADWEVHVNDHLKAASPDDAVAQYIRDSMAASVYKIN